MDCDSSSSVLFLLLPPTALGLRTNKSLLHCSRWQNFSLKELNVFGETFLFSEILFKRLNTFVVDASSLS